jgi:hypothetical protein
MLTDEQRREWWEYLLLALRGRVPEHKQPEGTHLDKKQGIIVPNKPTPAWKQQPNSIWNQIKTGKTYPTKQQYYRQQAAPSQLPEPEAVY